MEPLLTVQIISFDLQIIRNTCDFEEGLKSWHIRPTIEKRGKILKNTLRTNTTAYEEFKEPRCALNCLIRLIY